MIKFLHADNIRKFRTFTFGVNFVFVIKVLFVTKPLSETEISSKKLNKAQFRLKVIREAQIYYLSHKIYIHC